MSKKDQYKEPELIIDGQKVKFHYSRAERLAMKHDNPNQEKNCFFCLKNRGGIFLLIDFILIFLILMGYYYFIGKSKGVIRNNFYYNLSVKKDVNKQSIRFLLQIKNMINKKNELLNKEFKIELYDNYSNPVGANSLLVDKLEYGPKEFNTYQIDFLNIPSGKYRAVLKNNYNILIEMDFKIK